MTLTYLSKSQSNNISKHENKMNQYNQHKFQPKQTIHLTTPLSLKEIESKAFTAIIK